MATFANYEKTYGPLAGVIVFLLWVWIANLALLFGAEFDRRDRSAAGSCRPAWRPRRPSSCRRATPGSARSRRRRSRS
ncbi:YhjD/YihY/BrkB family envelope integrity protein [Leifsonia sp. L25]|uniref:YhjD/YihY/BrkB family envelope integrity protein n=1 Tax=Leifsonia sp. L25 TaxID=3423957 RepID=UPI003D688B65